MKIFIERFFFQGFLSIISSLEYSEFDLLGERSFESDEPFS